MIKRERERKGEREKRVYWQLNDLDYNYMLGSI